MALLIGFVAIVGLGIGHHFGILAIKLLTPDGNDRPHVSVISTFVGLLLLHLIEILIFAGIYRVLLEWPRMGTLGGGFDESWNGLIYFSGINFATLGYTQIETIGPIKMVNMMQSLGGFMVLTWSATFIYSVWGKAWRD